MAFSIPETPRMDNSILVSWRADHSCPQSNLVRLEELPERVDADSCCNLGESISLIPVLWRATCANSSFTNSGLEFWRKISNEVVVSTFHFLLLVFNIFNVDT